MEKKGIYKKAGRVFLFITLNLFFTVGVIWLAYNNRTRIKKWMDHDNSFSQEDKVIMYDIFSSPLINDEEDLVFPPVKSSEELISDLYKSTLPDSLDLLKIYDSCTVLSTEKYRRQVIKVKYLLFSDTLESFAYLKNTGQPGKKTTKAVLYISGSGDNKAGRVAERLIDEEDPTVQAEQINADIYFPVFPADDIRAIHDGTKMLDIKKIPSYMAGSGRNFALRYFADIFAVEKYLRKNYTVLHTWGHSRGGSIATIAASIFLPDTLIVSSGYSVSSDKFFRLGGDQAWWPNSLSFWKKNTMKTRLANKKTIAYFLFGKKETDDIYGLEAHNFYTEKFFKDCPNIKVRYSNNKHIWFTKEISEILAGK